MTDKSEKAVALLVPGALVVEIDGESIRVPTNKEENTILNALTSSVLRHMLMKSIKAYKDMDQIMTPKELRDLAAAAAEISKASSEVFANSEAINTGEKKAEPVAAFDLSALSKIPEVKPDGPIPDETHP